MSRFGRYTEGHYTIKRVDKLPKAGNANWLYAIRGPILDKFFRWDAHDKKYEIIYINSQGFIPGDTQLTFNSVTNELSLTFNDGTVLTTIIDIKGFVTVYTDDTGAEKHKIGDYLNEDNITTDIFETNTNIRLDGNNVIYTKEDGTDVSLDLTFLVDQALDTQVVSGTWVENLSTIVLTKNNGDNISITLTGLDNSVSSITNTSLSGNTIATHDNGEGVSVDINETITSLNRSGLNLTYTKEGGQQDNIDLSDLENVPETITNLQLIGNNLTYTKEDNTTDVVDLTPYLDDTNLSRIISGNLNTGILTLTRDDSTSFTVDLSDLIGGGSSGTLTNTLSSGNLIGVYNDESFSTNINESITNLDLDSYNKLSYTSEDGVSEDYQIDSLKPVSFSVLQSLISSNSLVKGLSYVITNFRSHYTQLETNIETTSSQAISDGIVPSVEPLIVTARTENELFKIARSLTHEFDIIHYDINQNDVSSGGFGKITRRVDTLRNIVGDFDWRTERFRTYEIDVPLYNSSNTYDRYDIVKVVNGSRFDFYINVSEPLFNTVSQIDEGSDLLTNRKKWALISENSLDPFIQNSSFVSFSRVGQDFIFHNLSANLSSFINEFSIDNEGTGVSSRNHDVYIERGIVIRKNAFNSSAFVSSSSVGNVICVNLLNNSYTRIDKNSFIFSLNYTNQNINSFIGGVTGNKLSSSFYTNIDPSEIFQYGDISNSYVSGLIVSEGINISQTIIKGGLNINTTNNQPTLNNMTIVNSGGSASVNSCTFNGTVSGFKVVDVRLTNVEFSDLTRVYMQNSNTPDSIDSQIDIVFRSCKFNSAMSSVYIRPEGDVASSFQSSFNNMNFLVPTILDSIVSLKTTVSPVGEFTVTAVYRDPATKFISMYQPVVDSMGNVTYQLYL